jgi:drug/metabolite transporter (DMT)-like permease
MIEILALYAIVAVTFTIGKMLLAFLPPIFLIGIRMSIAGSIILVAQYFLDRAILISKKDIPFFIMLSVIHIFIPYVTEFIALENITPACTALMYNLTPFFTALFSYLLFGQYMTPKKWLGFFISLIGVWCMMPSSSFICYSDLNGSFFLLLISVISCSLGWILFKKLLVRGYSALQVNGIAMIMGGAQAFACAQYFERAPIAYWYQNVYFWILLLTIILFANFIFYNLYGYFLHKYSATLLSFVGFLTPLFTAFYDYLFLGIMVSYEFYMAMIIVSYGIYMFYQEELRQGYVTK